jgi:hypothetical protein
MAAKSFCSFDLVITRIWGSGVRILVLTGEVEHFVLMNLASFSAVVVHVSVALMWSAYTCSLVTLP